jgi:RimJ/RimL family protein N-acetyltransferase
MWQEAYETERLRLRPLVMSDAAALYSLQRDRETMRFFGGPYQRDQTETWLEWHVAMWEQEGYSHWAAELRESRAFIGWIGLTKVWEPKEIVPAVEIGWFVDRSYWGRGLATEGGRCSLEFGFTDLGLDRIIARYDPDNVASGKVMEKLGMHHVLDIPRDDPEGISRIYEIRTNDISRGV